MASWLTTAEEATMRTGSWTSRMRALLSASDDAATTRRVAEYRPPPRRPKGTRAPLQTHLPIPLAETTGRAFELLPDEVRGAIGNAKGDVNELRVLEALALPTRPAWLLRARHRTPAEDEQGIDIVVLTTDGEVPLQVKSSRNASRVFRKRRRDRGLPPIAVVVVGEKDQPGALLAAAVLVLSPAPAR